jgi:HPr kinase/phosphorylase
MPESGPESGGHLLLHATAVAVAGRGLLILGASGSGKSGLALRMIALGARLVADDQVLLHRAGDTLVAEAPARLAGLIEARGIGILRLTPVERVPLAWAVDLDSAPAARLPHADTIAFLGMSIHLIRGRDLPNLDAMLTVLLENDRAEPDG